MPFILFASMIGILFFVPIAFLPLKVILRVVVRQHIELVDAIKYALAASCVAAILQILIELTLSANGEYITSRTALAALVFALMLVSGTVVLMLTEGIYLRQAALTSVMLAFLWVFSRVGLVGLLGMWLAEQKS